MYRILYAKVQASPRRFREPELPVTTFDTRTRSAPDAVAVIDRRPLHGEVAERLRAMITEGRLEPGARLNERVLCEQLQVSRTPLREALKVLAAERLVELNPNRGASVVALSRDDVEQLFEMMAALEGLAGSLAAQRRTPAELARVQALHRQMFDAHAAGDLAAYYDLNRRIHFEISRCARNAVLAETCDSVNIRIQNLRFRSNLKPERWDRAVEEHRRILAAFEVGDGECLRALLEEHLRHKRDAVLEDWTAPRQPKRKTVMNPALPDPALIP
jgi:DNA-binding GntR family transcriptional regulator